MTSDMADKTTIDWNNYFREVCTDALLAQSTKEVGGHNLVVEINERFISKWKYNAGHQLPQQWIFGGIFRQTNEYFVIQVPGFTTCTLMEAIENNIAQESIIYSDSWQSYNLELLLETGIQHLKLTTSTISFTQKTVLTQKRSKCSGDQLSGEIKSIEALHIII